MSSYFHQQSAPWFRIGRLEVTTTIAVVLLGAVGMLAWVFAPSAQQWLVYSPQQILSGEVWRLFTWPLADGISLWGLINLALIWLFGRDLEAQIGRAKMIYLFVGIWFALTLMTSLVGLLVSGAAIAGLQMVEFCLLLLWIAEWPTRRFFFNIPAWVFGLVILALQVLPLLAYRAWGNLLGLFLALALVAINARRLGLLSQYAWIPGAPSARTPRRQAAAPKQRKHAERKATDSERIDQLLDKINASGIHSLTKSERAELEKLRQRRR
ncbi:Membrane associated serine protease, rhomboid family [Tessaracoccus bendigoensis DSM 12906]|uniref:Membrane associated serine protease, rhomboid family n=1 Tax=Tessaracoccus bendigoensis DSM 12906 TaxID=1123357 RepID=A0A1M6KB27_9ACTN|nr:rhomboid family intramembrane serine protease [Tessaracoccus bendigoensis]SHJ56156.1 Membrane associated serine protease, rhomboid family [Tessaracoccus bendigoensis DSM 12906]